MRSAFSFEAVSRCVRASDVINFGVDLKDKRREIVEAAVDAATSEQSPLGTFSRAVVRKKPCIVYNEYSSVLLLRSMSRYITQRFRLTIPNRDRVIKSVIEAMSDSSPFTVIRRDVSSFYENIPISGITERLLHNTSVPRSLRHHLETFLETHCGTRNHGLPRGVGLSTVLVELAMQEFDRSVREISGVYKYFRYSDDILIFCFKNKSHIENVLDEILPAPMIYNLEKSATIDFFEKKGSEIEVGEFSYLGYLFSAQVKGRGSKARDVDVSISPDKIRRLKSRVVLSFKSHIAQPNASLLLKRMKFLSGNFRISKAPGHYEALHKHVWSGIFYNYRRCGTYRNLSQSPSPRTELQSVDWFYHRLISGPYATDLAGSLSPLQLTQLNRISFAKGHEKRIGVNVSGIGTNELKAAWRSH